MNCCNKKQEIFETNAGMVDRHWDCPTLGTNSRYMLFSLESINYGKSKCELRGLSQLRCSTLFYWVAGIASISNLLMKCCNTKQENLRQKRGWSLGIGTVPRWELIPDTCFSPSQAPMSAHTNVSCGDCPSYGATLILLVCGHSQH